ncbi:hypothetical protein PQX77_006152 [Marasmius sp. AFHP31]|nr:hypothetical protein PQX77_006152 [Marasmius sp. AFHP31]
MRITREDLSDEVRRELSGLKAISGDQRKLESLLNQENGDEDQSNLNILQLIADLPSSTPLRSLLLKLTSHLSTHSRRSPQCLILQDVKMVGSNPIGSGRVGEVWRAKIGQEHTSQLECAVKIVKKSYWSRKDQEPNEALSTHLRQAILWRRMRHPHVLPFVGTYYLNDSGEDNVCFVSLYMRNGNLGQYLDQTPPELVHSYILMYDIALGLEFLHDQGIVHGNLTDVRLHLSPGQSDTYHHVLLKVNVFIRVDFRACIGDFGLAPYGHSDEHPPSLVQWRGALGYTAPDLLLGGPISKESDIYSFGSVCYMIFSKTHSEPPGAPNTLRRPPKHTNDTQFQALLQDCWRHEPSARPIASEIVGRVIAMYTGPGLGIAIAPTWLSLPYSGILNNLNIQPLITKTPIQQPSEPRSATPSAISYSTYFETEERPPAGSIGQGHRDSLDSPVENDAVTFNAVTSHDHPPLRAASTAQSPQHLKALVVVAPDSPEFVDRQVRALLNKLSNMNFNPISNEIIAWVNKSERETDGRTLYHIAGLIFDKAIDEAKFARTYALLCHKMSQRISPMVQCSDERDAYGRLVEGGQLFKKYILNRCQESFERGWEEDESAGDAPLYSDSYYASQKAKRRGLGLVKFIGELFNSNVMTERIVHGCLQKLLLNVETPKEEDLESLCVLLTTVGPTLDTPRARAHVDVYFSRMREVMNNPAVSQRIVFMLQDVIDLRARRRTSKGTTVGNPLSGRAAVVRKPQHKPKKGTRAPPNYTDRPRFAYETPTTDPSASGARKKLILQPRTKPLASHSTSSKPSSDSLLPKAEPETSDTESSSSAVDTQQEIEEDTDEFFAVRSIKEAEIWFQDKSPDYLRRVVQNLISVALRSEEASVDVRLVSDLLQRASGKVFSLDVLEDAFCSVAELLDDILCDVPSALELFAVMINGASFSHEQRERIASKLEGNGDDFLDRVE